MGGHYIGATAFGAIGKRLSGRGADIAKRLTLTTTETSHSGYRCCGLFHAGFSTLNYKQLKGAGVALSENDPGLLQFQPTRRHCVNCDKVDHFLALLPSSNIATSN
jgi:hypothetical protein